MPDPRFFSTLDPIPLESLPSTVPGGWLISGTNRSGSIERVASSDTNDLHNALIFLEGETAGRDFLRQATNSNEADKPFVGPAALFIDDAAAECLPEELRHLAYKTTASPKAAFAHVAEKLHQDRTSHIETRYHAASDCFSNRGDVVVDSSARIGDGAEIGEGCVIGPHASIGPGVVLGAGSVVEPGAVVTHSYIGEESVIGANCVVGGAGFGLVEIDGRPKRFPQLGIVRLGDRVELGSGTTVDRAALTETAIGDDTKIDNLVQIGHNVKIGRACAIASHCGLAGGAQFGDGVIMGGHSGVGEGVIVGAGARLASKSGFMRAVPAGETWGGTPAMPSHLYWRMILYMQRASRPKAKQKNGD
ncbi:MAG: UDP-3-O-(3-hydroxymyristoyl)glucosamine N-acyltransferase [Pseudomonadota bacterium]